jgi:hypothetical protein
MSLRVTSSGGCGAALLWVMAAGWSAAVAFFAVLVERSESAATAGAWAALALFGVVGLFLIALAIRASVSVARFRGVSIDLQTNPGILGGTLAGVVHLRHRMGPLQLTLSNWHLDDSDELLWESTTTLGADALDLPFSFEVPFDCERTSGTASWRLVLAENASFTIPVMQTDASSPARTQQALRAATYAAPEGTKVTVERRFDGTTVRFPLPSWVARWYLIVLLLAAGAYLAAMYAMAAIGVVVLCAIPLPTLAMIVRRIDADRTGLTLRYAMLRGAKRIPAAALRDVGAVYANGAMHYELTFAGAEKAASWTIITLRSRPEADWVAYELRRALR